MREALYFVLGAITGAFLMWKYVKIHIKELRQLQEEIRREARNIGHIQNTDR